MTEDYAAIEIGDVYLDSWTSYRFDSDLFTPADGFSLAIGIGTSSSKTLRQNLAKLRDVLKPGEQVKFWIGHGSKRTLQGTGIIDSREITNDSSGTRFGLEGRDLAALMFSAADLSLYSAGGTLLDLIRAATATWGIKVKADTSSMRDIRTGKASAGGSARALQDKAQALGIPARRLSGKLIDAIDNGTLDVADLGISPTAANRTGSGISPLQVYALKVKQARVQSGETVWDFLDRHAQRLGVLMRMGPDGVLNLLAPDYGQAPLYSLRRTIDGESVGAPFSGISQNPNNILSGGERYDTSSLFNRVTVSGKLRKGQDDPRTSNTITVEDASPDSLPFERTLRIQSDTVRGTEELNQRGWRELAKSRMGVRVLDYEVRGHGSNGSVFAADTVVQVRDEIVGVNDPFYVAARTFVRDENGPRTRLKLVPLGSIVIGE